MNSKKIDQMIAAGVLELQHVAVLDREDGD
jgi:hypothetical protein